MADGLLKEEDGDQVEEWKRVVLISKLTGAAYSWLTGQGSAWGHLSYQELKAALMDHFKGESALFVCHLEELRCTGTVTEFNKEFVQRAAAALPILGEFGVKRAYINQLRPFSLQK